MPAPRFVLDDFWPSDLFLGGIPGAWYDPTDLSTMFQDSAGTTPVTAVEQPVGLILDKSQGLALGAELVTNGDFSGGTTGWTAGGTTTLTVNAGVMRAAGTTDGAFFGQQINVVAGRWYQLQFSILSDGTSKAAQINLGTALGSGNRYAGSIAFGTNRSVYYYAASTETLWLWFYPGFFGSANYILVDDVTVKSVAGNHASQSTAASRPTYRARYNLVTYSEEFQNGYWSKTNATVSADSATAPNGTTTADTITENLVVGGHYLGRFTVTTSRATTYTWSAYAKPNGRNQILLGLTNAAGTQSDFLIDLTTLAATLNSNGAAVGNFSGAASSVGNGWVRVSITFTTTNDANGDATGLIVWLGNSKSYAGDGASGIFLWGAQILTAADVTATGNAYQRIAATTVYDTAPIFRPYLAFDGVDDSLSTAAINFTSTDKMTVFVGASKLSDAASGNLVELSVNKNLNAGTFYMWFPELSPTGDIVWVTRGTVNTSPFARVAIAAPVTAVITGTGDIPGDNATIRINNVSNTTTADQGAGSFGTYPLFIGRRGGVSQPFNGRLYSLIVRGAASSVTEIADTELWVNARTGAF